MCQKMKVENCYRRTMLRNSLKTSEMTEDNVMNHPWNFRVQKKSGSHDMVHCRIWACLGSFWENSNFSSLVYGSDFIAYYDSMKYSSWFAYGMTCVPHTELCIISIIHARMSLFTHFLMISFWWFHWWSHWLENAYNRRPK